MNNLRHGYVIDAHTHSPLSASCPAVLLSCCSAVLLFCCPAVLLFCCPAVLLSCCSVVLLSCCSVVLLFCCPAVVVSLSSFFSFFAVEKAEKKVCFVHVIEPYRSRGV